MKIDPANNPILSFSDSHPAKRFLILHQEFNRRWVGFEISYSTRPAIPDLEWCSDQTNGTVKLSGLLYKFISFTPVLVEWLESSHTLSEYEQQSLDTIRLIHHLINTAERDCLDQIKPVHHEMMQELRMLLAAWEHSITIRIDFQQGNHHV